MQGLVRAPSDSHAIMQDGVRAGTNSIQHDYYYVPSWHDSQSAPDHPGKHSHVPELEHALVFEHVASSQYVSQCCIATTVATFTVR